MSAISASHHPRESKVLGASKNFLHMFATRQINQAVKAPCDEVVDESFVNVIASILCHFR